MSCEMLFQDPLFVVPMIMLWTVIALLLLIVYIPRIDEIIRLRRIIRNKDAMIDQLSKQQTQSELEHVADMEQIRGDQAAAEHNAETSAARVEQYKDLNRQIAEAADKLTKEAQA